MSYYNHLFGIQGLTIMLIRMGHWVRFDRWILRGL